MADLAYRCHATMVAISQCHATMVAISQCHATMVATGQCHATMVATGQCHATMVATGQGVGNRPWAATQKKSPGTITGPGLPAVMGGRL